MYGITARHTGHRPRHSTGLRDGFTLVEVLVALALISIATLAAVGVRPGAAVRAAQATRTFLLWARLEAMWSGRAVAVKPGALPGLVALAASDGTVVDACAGAPLKELEVRRFGKVTLLRELRSAIVWLPTGGARSCDGGGVISGRMILKDAFTTVDVVVSSLGRVRVQVER